MSTIGYKELNNIPFPKCGKNCWALKHFGVCECENLCPHKFDKQGNPLCLECGLGLNPECEIELSDGNKKTVCGLCADNFVKER